MHIDVLHIKYSQYLEFDKELIQMQRYRMST